MMKWKIGFSAEEHKKETVEMDCFPAAERSAPRKSVVRVHFPARSMTLSYYNDRFVLHTGDRVFVDGKLEGLQGRVVDVSYNFKIKLSDYQRVIAVADTQVHGRFHLAGSHAVTFDTDVLPYEKVRTWFCPPDKEDDEYVSGCDEKEFSLERLQDMGVSEAIAERGANYYRENRVLYLSVDNGCGRAIVAGGEYYTVEFEYADGMVSHLNCSCFCAYPCKHQFAAMLQLKETLEHILKHYEETYTRSGYFAAISKGTLFNYVLEGREMGSFTLE